MRIRPDGAFTINRVIPGPRDSARFDRGAGRGAGFAFEELGLEPGEVRELRDLRTRPPMDVRNH